MLRLSPLELHVHLCTDVNQASVRWSLLSICCLARIQPKADGQGIRAVHVQYHSLGATDPESIQTHKGQIVIKRFNLSPRRQSILLIHKPLSMKKSFTPEQNLCYLNQGGMLSLSHCLASIAFSCSFPFFKSSVSFSLCVFPPPNTSGNVNSTPGAWNK